ncbi:hypothetical protein [Trujillonella humicola]|uniref:hypothetical protein n=1 Tax=Trujillonella humicola TaxID=3383699 RepID=UPI0039063C87
MFRRRWGRDGRTADAGRSERPTGPAQPPVDTCRHGVRAGEDGPVGRAPVLRALSVSHDLVRPGSSVVVGWCFEDADEVVVDGRRGHPACGEALVRIDRRRPVEVIGRNGHACTPVATSTVVTTAAVPLDLPPVPDPLRGSPDVDLAATVGVPTAARLHTRSAARRRLR